MMKIYNEKKICFIICTNSKQYLEECLLYLNFLEIPDGYETELLTIEGAQSITVAYNEAMNASDAKYKIYIHQDTFIIKRDILHYIIDVFQTDETIGVIGTLGCEKLSKTGVIRLGELCGGAYKEDRAIEKIEEDYREVEAVDGSFIATQYDFPWREDVITGWSFHDVSQCLEFRKNGYKIVVPAQESEWIIHPKREVKCSQEYEVNRELLVQEYKELLKTDERYRILFVHSDMIIIGLLMVALAEMGHEVKEMPHRVKIARPDIKDEKMVEEMLENGYYDLVMTYDFIETVSNACQKQGVKYCAWVYDSPLFNLYTTPALNDVNYISVFDRKQYERLLDRGYAHLAYFPLAAGISWFGALNITEEDEKEYSADVSFVGNLYAKRGFEEAFRDAPKQYLEEAETIIKSHNCEWDGTNKLFGKPSDELIDYMISRENINFFKQYDIDKRYYCESIRLGGKCNEYERITILNKIAEQFKVVLYTTQQEQKELKNIEIRPAVYYDSVMPKIFYLSKINLNISSRSIESGIPQRVWDIMAVGGFCLTNYQPELEEYFEIGKDIEVYHNLEELVSKIDYYLKHEKERIRIAINGYKKVREHHSYEKRMTDVLKWVFEEK